MIRVIGNSLFVYGVHGVYTRIYDTCNRELTFQNLRGSEREMILELIQVCVCDLYTHTISLSLCVCN